MNRGVRAGLRLAVAALDHVENACSAFSLARAPEIAREPKRILVWTMDRIGDVQRATGLFRALKARWPGCEITAAVAGRSAGVLLHNPRISAIHTVTSPHRLAQHARMLRDLKATRFELGVLAEVDPHWAKLGHWSMRALGVSTWSAFDLGGPIPSRCRPVPLRADRSWTELFGDLASAVGADDDGQGTELHLSRAERDRAGAILAEHGIASSTDFVLMHPGGNFLTVSRQWPAERFGRLVDLLADRGLTVVMTGLPQERATVDRVRAAASAPFVDLCGRLSLRELAGVIAASRLCVTNDTGPLHIAQALRRPTVVVLGPTAPAVVGLSPSTRAVTADLPCRPCAYLGGWRACSNPEPWACLTAVTPEAVFAAATKQLGVGLPLPSPSPSPLREARG